MPVITFDGGTLTREKKAEISKELTDSASRITGIPVEKFIVFINEHSAENIATGGRLLADQRKEPTP